MASIPTRAGPAPTLVAARSAARHYVWQAPLVPVALMTTVGIILDRSTGIPLWLSLLVIPCGLLLWAVTRQRRPALPLTSLGLALLALGAAYHHLCRETFRSDDIGNYATPEPHPVHLRGILEQEPPLSGLQEVLSEAPPEEQRTLSVLAVTQLQRQGDWIAVSGRARLLGAGRLEGLHVGDEVDVIGRLSAPRAAANPGEWDEAAHLQDQRIRAVVDAHKSPEAVLRLAEGWPRSLNGWLAMLRGWGERVLWRYLPPEQRGHAMALLLGEGSAMRQADWARYKQTGVVHVLIIAGQHLGVLALVLWRALRVLTVRRRWSGGIVALVLLGYALLTGAHPPVVRSVVTACVCCGGIVLRRPSMPANALALAWLVVTAVNPTDLFSPGCQLTFLSVVLLYWGVGPFLERQVEPLDQLAEETRPAWERWLRRGGRQILSIYLVSLFMWVVETPLVAARFHIVAPAGAVILPIVMLFTMCALVCGFLLLLVAAVCPLLAPLFAWPTGWSLALCDRIVSWSVRLRGGHWFISDIPEWWLWGFYAGVLAVLWVKPIRRRWRWVALAGITWLCLGLGIPLNRGTAGELRCTFLAVGHGGCTVLETPDGRVLLYDAGALWNPGVTERQIAPYLWSRGIRRIDEIFLSHGDEDHFNGVLDLLERFPVGQVTGTPTFHEKSSPGKLLRALENQYGLHLRVVKEGDRLTAGNVEMEVLNPPVELPGDENAHSMALLVRHAGHTIFLTGDLNGPGLHRVLALPPTRLDVLQAPHHGSHTSNTPELAQWARPKVVISCQEPPHNPSPNPYTPNGAHYLETWAHGAITVRSHATGLVVETFVTEQRFTVRREGVEADDRANRNLTR